MNIRPRTTGEILDDAWRLYLADAPVLLAMGTVFVMPAAVVLLLLLAWPTPEPWAGRLVLPGVVALLIPLTGLSSAVCQEAFRLRADEQPIRWRPCLRAVVRRGLDHMAGRALIAGVLVLCLPLLRLPMLTISEPMAAALAETAPVLGFIITFLSWTAAVLILAFVAAISGALTLHPIIAEGEQHFLSAWRSAMAEAQRQAGKAGALAFSRPPMWALAVLNLHLLVRAGLWVGDDLAGFDWALASALLTVSNPTYVTALVLLAGMLLAPFWEASNYLLHVDARARYEGLDLWYRVRRHFPAAVAVLLLVGALASSAHGAAADPRAALAQARQVVVQVRQEVRAAEPYPGGKHWLPPLQAAVQALDERKTGRLRWFDDALTELAKADRAQAVAVLTDLEQRLALLEDSVAPEAGGKSRQDVKALLPQTTAPESAREEKAAKRENKRPVRRDEAADDGPVGGGGKRGVVAPAPDFALGPIGWYLLLGLLIAAVLTALVKIWQRRPARRTVAATTPAAPSLETLLAANDRAVGEGLWRQADELAQDGRWLEALRMLYLAVLALLHRADLIRYAQTRTNREYLEQLRARAQVYPPFEGLTEAFELKWYGEKSCQPDDYQTCRALANRVREGIPPR